MIHTVKGFIIVHEAEIDVLLEFPSFFYDPRNVGNLVYDSSAFSKSSLYIWYFSVPVLFELLLKDFEHYLASNCVVLETFFDIAFLWDWNEN